MMTSVSTTIQHIHRQVWRLILVNPARRRLRQEGYYIVSSRTVWAVE